MLQMCRNSSGGEYLCKALPILSLLDVYLFSCDPSESKPSHCCCTKWEFSLVSCPSCPLSCDLAYGWDSSWSRTSENPQVKVLWWRPLVALTQFTPFRISPSLFQGPANFSRSIYHLKTMGLVFGKTQSLMRCGENDPVWEWKWGAWNRTIRNHPCHSTQQSQDTRTQYMGIIW